MSTGVVFPTTHFPLWLATEVVALLLVAACLRLLERHRRRRLDAFVAADLAPRLLVGHDARARRPLSWLTILGFGFLGLAIAQPHWGQEWQEVRQFSRDILVCLDTSESMRATDVLPSRLDRAKAKIAAMMQAAPGDRFGLVAFSGGAALQCPLTVDHGYFKAVLSAVDTDSITEEGTDIALALEEAAQALREKSPDGREDGAARSREYRAVVLISDGEDISENAVEKAEELARLGRVYVLGVGDPQGAEVKPPMWMGYHRPVTDMARGHVSHLDEETLTRIALAGDGRYVRSTPDGFDIDRIVEHLRGVAGRPMEDDLRFELVNRYQWPLALAIACFAGEGLWLVALPWLRRRRARREAAVQAEVSRA